MSGSSKESQHDYSENHGRYAFDGQEIDVKSIKFDTKSIRNVHPLSVPSLATFYPSTWVKEMGEESEGEAVPLTLRRRQSVLSSQMEKTSLIERATTSRADNPYILVNDNKEEDEDEEEEEVEG